MPYWIASGRNLWKIKLGDAELKPGENWQIAIKDEGGNVATEDILLDVSYNHPQNSNMYYIKSVTFYVPLTKDGAFTGIYEKYTVNVGTSIAID